MAENALFPKPGTKWPEAPLILEDAHRLVGAFMWNWAALEAHLDTAIRRILRVEFLTMTMLGVHLQVNSKIQLLRCAVALFSVPDEQWAKDAKKTFNDIETLSQHRNILAHTGFGVSSDKTAVKFHRIKATGTLSAPETNWTPEKFGTAVLTMSALMEEIKAIIEKVVLRRSKVAMRGKTQENYLQRLLQLGTQAGADAAPSTIAEVLAERKRAEAKGAGAE